MSNKSNNNTSFSVKMTLVANLLISVSALIGVLILTASSSVGSTHGNQAGTSQILPDKEFNQSLIVDSVPCVIITPASLKPSYQPLADWKTRKGTKTEIKTVGSIDSTYTGLNLPEKIRNFIKDNYINKKTLFVILGGGVNVVPCRYVQMADRSVLTDYYYSCLDGTWNFDNDSYYGELEDSVDLAPEVYVGRIPLDTAGQITNFITKLLSYERDSPYLYYQNKVLLLSSRLHKNGDGLRFCDSTAAHIPNWFQKSKLYEYSSQSGIDSLNAGFGIVFNYSHAQNYNNFLSIYDIRDDINNAEIGSLNNTNRYSIFINSTCFDNNLDSNCLSKHFMKNPSGGGIAYIGSSKYDQPYETQSVHENFLGQIFLYSNRNIGKALAITKTNLIPDAQTLNNGCRYTMFAYTLLGDPQMVVWDSVPRYLSQFHPEGLYKGQQYTITDTVKDVLTTTPVAGATVCLMKGNDVYKIGTTNSNGIVSFTATFPNTGVATLVATHPDYIPDSSGILISDPPCSGCGGGGCPFVYAWDGEQFVQDNTILTASEYNRYPVSVTDHYLLTRPLIERNGKYNLEVREFEKEETELDQVELIAVDHPKNTGIGIAPNGNIIVYDRILQAIACIDNEGEEQLEKILKKDGEYFKSDGPGYLILTFNNNDLGKLPNDFQPEAAPEDQAGPPPPEKRLVVSNRLLLEIEDVNGEWHKVGDVAPRANVDRSYWVLGANDISLGQQFRVKISWDLSYSVDWLGYFPPTKSGWFQSNITVARASHSSKGDVTTLISGSDRQPVKLIPGEVINLSFPSNIPGDTEMKRNFVLKAVGYYKRYDRSASQVNYSFSLDDNYPNPFNAVTEIKYSLSEPSEVSLSIYNIMGQRVKTLVNGIQNIGVHKVTWDGRNEKGEVVASGVYFYSLKAGTYIETKKMTLLK